MVFVIFSDASSAPRDFLRPDLTRLPLVSRSLSFLYKLAMIDLVQKLFYFFVQSTFNTDMT